MQYNGCIIKWYILYYYIYICNDNGRFKKVSAELSMHQNHPLIFEAYLNVLCELHGSFGMILKLERKVDKH